MHPFLPRPSKIHFALLAILLLAFAGTLRAQSAPAAPTGCAAMLERWKGIAVVPLPEWRVRAFESAPAGGAPELDDANWESVKMWTWPKEPGTSWFRRWVEVPAARGGYDLRNAPLRFRVNVDGDYPVFLSIYVNGTLRAQGYYPDPLLLSAFVEPGQKVLIALKADAPAGKVRLHGVQLEFGTAPGRPDARMLLESCTSAELINATSGDGKERRAQQFDSARNAIEWAALERNDQRAFDDSLRRAQEKLEPLRPWLESFSIRAVGNAHIDMAWLWPWTETVEVTRNTFGSVLNLMQEYPDLTFTHGSPSNYAWMEEKYPSLFEQIRRRVKEGRWEVIGGMWVESDQNLPDGESFARQLLHGKRYFKEKFGVDVRTGWTPDSFGYNWQLPQLYKKSGIDFFVTQKIGWNDTTKFPHKLFWWESPDGSRVLTYFPHDYVNQIEPVRMARDIADQLPKTKSPELMHLYGIGDHGGGPTREMLESARRWQAPGALYPRIRFSTAQSFFDDISKKLDTLTVPTWKNELYLEYHRGTFTTQAKTKQNNRRSETLMLNAEKFSSLATLFGRAYPQTELNEAWRKVLFNQFHDILPGSSIAPVYVDSERDHAEVRRSAGGILTSAMQGLAARIRTTGTGAPVIVFNPLAWERNDVVEADVPLAGAPANITVRDTAGKTMLAEVVSRNVAAQSVRVRFLAEAVPSLGYKVFHVASASPAQVKAAAAATRVPFHPVTARPNLLENDFWRVRADEKSGCITSIFDKKFQREYLAPNSCGNLLQAFRDKPKDWDAWNIDADFENQKWDLTDAEEVKLVETGPVRGVIRVVRKFQNSRFVQNITLTAGIPRVDIRMEADWHEEHILIKAAIAVAAKSDFATYEIPYGSIQRPTTRNTPAEKAMFEVPALRWADISDASGGISLLNDSKYGHDAKGNVLRISLLRSPKWPDANADMGHHEFTYSIYPHVGSWKESGTVRRGYELNIPLLAIATQAHTGALPPAHSFLSLEPANVVLTAIKKAEDDDGIMIRFYESAGRETQVKLRLPPGAARAVETNLMEKEEKALSIEKNGEVVVSTRPYEIKTVKLKFAPSAQ
ncbi:MAG: alpha-mannosidase [Acidobacteria bacterium]|nr:alpha-mannosidase [Acidobacteriota bacterium]